MQSSPEKQREFVRLIIAHQPNLRAYIISLMPGVEGAADVLQEVNLVLWEKMHTFEMGTNFRAWAFAIARLEVKSHFRHLHKTEIPMLPDSVAAKLADQFDELYEAKPEHVEVRLRALKQCLKRLDGKDRKMVEARYTGANNIRDFAVSTGIPANTLRVKLHRIRNGLRRCITERLRLRAIGDGNT